MANWCSNTVEFIGEHSQFEKLEKLFKEMAKKEKVTKRGQLPPFGSFDNGWLFEVRWEQGILYYETKWSPNVGVIQAIADHFKMGFSYAYSEPGNCVYGEANYKDGTLTDISLDWDDNNLYALNEETNLFDFEGEGYESSEEIIDILLERKKAAYAIANPHQNPNQLL